MASVEHVFERFGGPTAVASALGVKVSAASEMRRRSSIPVRYWRRLVAAASERGMGEFTYDLLVEMHSKRAAS
jgi:hypothetical protein